MYVLEVAPPLQTLFRLHGDLLVGGWCAFLFLFFDIARGGRAGRAGWDHEHEPERVVGLCMVYLSLQTIAGGDVEMQLRLYACRYAESGSLGPYP